MAYFEDFSNYSYFHCYSRTGTYNVGWLDDAHAFEKAETPEDVIELLWNFCKVSFAQARGFHQCNLSGCSAMPQGSGLLQVVRNGTALKLGSAEIRVFGNDGSIYAAPNLIFHYVTAHQYKLPDRFVDALRSKPSPGSVEYAKKAAELGLKMTKTLGQPVM